MKRPIVTPIEWLLYKGNGGEVYSSLFWSQQFVQRANCADLPSVIILTDSNKAVEKIEVK